MLVSLGKELEAVHSAFYRSICSLKRPTYDEPLKIAALRRMNIANAWKKHYAKGMTAKSHERISIARRNNNEETGCYVQLIIKLFEAKVVVW
jgi:hypothetical protein